MIKLTTISYDDLDFFFEIKSDPDNMYWCDGARPLYSNIEKYLCDVIEKKEKYKNRSIYIISNEQVKMGYVYIDKHDLTAEFSIAVMSKYAGQGVASQTLRVIDSMFIAGNEFSRLFSWIRNDNVKSQHVLEKAGWVASGQKKEQKIQNIDNTVIMLEYIKEAGK